MAQEEDVAVTTVDDLSDVAPDRPRRLSEYKSTNMPLSASEIAQDEAKDTEHLGWAPRTLENIGDMKPLPERGQTEPRPTGPRA
jgi:predicted transcriptional regulator